MRWTLLGVGLLLPCVVAWWVLGEDPRGRASPEEAIRRAEAAQARAFAALPRAFARVPEAPAEVRIVRTRPMSRRTADGPLGIYAGGKIL